MENSDPNRTGTAEQKGTADSIASDWGLCTGKTGPEDAATKLVAEPNVLGNSPESEQNKSLETAYEEGNEGYQSDGAMSLSTETNSTKGSLYALSFYCLTKALYAEVLIVWKQDSIQDKMNN